MHSSWLRYQFRTLIDTHMRLVSVTPVNAYGASDMDQCLGNELSIGVVNEPVGSGSLWLVCRRGRINANLFRIDLHATLPVQETILKCISALHTEQSWPGTVTPLRFKEAEYKGSMQRTGKQMGGQKPHACVWVAHLHKPMLMGNDAQQS
jgi:hypothetical protein